MYKTLFLPILSTILIGCSSSNELKHFNKEEIQVKAMQHTKKADVVIKKEVNVLLWATYLNNINIKEFKTDLDSFITSIYFVNSKSQDIKTNGYLFTLNSEEPISIKEISTDDVLYKDTLLKNSWGRYYLIRFKKNEEDNTLVLKLSNSNSNSAELEFER